MRWLVLVSLLFAFGARADSPSSEAREIFERGKLKFNVGKFDEALEAFSRAYELEPAPLLLFNMGQCHRQLKQHERALFFFEGYLRDEPNSADSELVRSLIREERFAMQMEAEAPAASPPAPEPRPVPIAPPEPEPEPESTWVPWAIGGGVVVALVAAAGVTAATIALAPSGPTLGELDLR